MPPTRTMVHSPPDVQSWVDNIALDVPSRPDHDGPLLRTSSDAHSDNNISAPSASRRSSDQSNHHVSQDGTTNAESAAQKPAVSLHTPVSATSPSRSRSLHSTAANVGLGHRDSISGSFANARSLPGLPASRDSSAGSKPTDTNTNRNFSSFEQLRRSQPIDPPNIPLPSGADLSLAHSFASSRETIGVESVNAVTDSLEQIQHLHSALILPESTEAVSLDGPSTFVDAPRPPTPDRRDYWQRIEPLTYFMPHLTDIFPSKGRHRHAGKVACIDYRSDGYPQTRDEIDVVHFKSRSGRRRMARQLIDIGIVDDPTVTSRVLLVEDLCPETIEMLDTAFDLDPEFFAEHLNRSGYDAEDYGEVDAARWNTSHLGKDYVNLTWCRPVYQNPLLTKWLRAPRNLLNRGEGRTDGTSILTWRDAIFTAIGKRNPLAREHRLRVETNIFRQSWSLLAGSAGLDGQLHVSDNTALNDLRSKLVPTAWQERASFSWIRGTDVPMGIILLDPLPKITDVHTPLYPRGNRNMRPHSRQNDSDDSVHSSSTNASAEVEVEVALPMGPRLPMDERLNKYRANDAELGSLKDSFTCLRSTSWSMQNPGRSVAGTAHSGGLSDPIVLLLRIVEHDTRVFLRSLEWALDDIGNDSLDEYLLTRRLSDWRKLMSEFEKEVPAISARLENFVHFVYGSDPNKSLPDEVDIILRTVRENVATVKTRLDEAYADLRVDMQFNESRRSMNETQTVTRLTELAFMFIPLSFCASLFSMSIHELDNGVPVWVFVITALAMVSIAYGVRLLVGSELLANSIRRSSERFWEMTGVKPSETDKAPVFTIIRFTVQEIWESTKGVLLVGTTGSFALTAPLVIPIVFMWTFTNMGTGFKAAITVFLLASVATVILLALALTKFGPITSSRHRRAIRGSEA